MGTILGVSEIAVFLCSRCSSSCTPAANTISVFGTGHTPSGYKGITVIAGSVYTCWRSAARGRGAAGRGGQEPGADRAEGSSVSTLSIGIFYVFTTYAADVAFGPPGSPPFTSSGAAPGRAWRLAVRAVLVLRLPRDRHSTIGNANAGSTSRRGFVRDGTDRRVSRGARPRPPQAPLPRARDRLVAHAHRRGTARPRPPYNPVNGSR